MNLWHQWQFWAAIVFAILVKVRASPPGTPLWGRIVSVLIVPLAAVALTVPVLEILGLPTDVTTSSIPFGMAALVGLTAEHAARHLLALSPRDILRFWGGSR